jgi:membrane protease YdiL (CAAX protease family)
VTDERPAGDDDLARRLRGFGPVGILAIVVVLAGNFLFAPLSAIFALLWTQRSQTPWKDIGYVRPKSWPATAAIGIVLGIAFKFLMKAVVMPLLGADPVNHAYHYLAGNTAALPGAIYAMIVVAGFGEETLFRGYLFERLGKVLGRSTISKASIVVITSIWFGAAHYPVQGLAGVQQATVVGLVFGSIFAATGQIWMLMFAHAAFDLTALAMIYWDAETAIAHLVFK